MFGSHIVKFEIRVLVFDVGRREWEKWGWFNLDGSGDGRGGLTRYCVTHDCSDFHQIKIRICVLGSLDIVLNNSKPENSLCPEKQIREW